MLILRPVSAHSKQIVVRVGKGAASVWEMLTQSQPPRLSGKAKRAGFPPHRRKARTFTVPGFQGACAFSCSACARATSLLSLPSIDASPICSTCSTPSASMINVCGIASIPNSFATSPVTPRRRGTVTTHFSSFIFLHTSVVCPVFESIRVVTARQLQVTVLAFSCLTITQCSMVSAVSGGARLRMGGGTGPAVTGFFGPQPVRIKHAPSRQAPRQPSGRRTTGQAFFMPSVFALPRPLVDGNLDYCFRIRGDRGIAASQGVWSGLSCPPLLTSINLRQRDSNSAAEIVLMTSSC